MGKRIKAESATQSFLRSVGLKAVQAGKHLKRKDPHDCGEQKKVIISTSRRIALTRIGVHLLPVTISVFVIAFNTVELLNGPNLPGISTFFLQVAAKFHELTITGSLTVVALDVIRHQLLNEGINIGLLSSGFSFIGLNFLWSPNLLSTFRTKYLPWSKIRLSSIIILCCILAAVVGPASALLFIPVQVWKDYGGTEFYLGGSDNQLWPNHFTANHSGPEICHQNPPVLETVCPYGGFQTLSNGLRFPPSSSFQILLDDRKLRRIVNGHTYTYGLNVTTTETWAHTPRGDTSHFLQDLHYKQTRAQRIATGRNRRLRDFTDGGYMMSEGRIPVGRTVCGPTAVIKDDTAALLFPVLASDHKWRNISSFGIDQTWGPLKELKIGGLQRIEITTKPTQVRAKWVALGSEFGAATAGMAVVSQNQTTAIGRACTLDCRWALGQTFRKGNIVLNAFETLIGKPPKTTGSTFWDFGRADFFDPSLVPWYGDTIKVDQEWLDTLSTWSVLSSDAGGYNMSGIEALLDATVIASPEHTMFLGPESAYDSLVMLEYITSVYFVDAISRTGWDLSLLYANNTIINPVLQQESTEKQKILNGGPVFSRPTNIPYSVLKVSWHTYGAAWTLQDSGQWISVGILGVHMVIAIVHSLIIVVRRRSMGTWDSIEELVVLAWNSMPTRRNDELKNCSSGILRTKTLESKVRVVAVEEQGMGSRVELVMVDEMARNKDGRLVDMIKPGEAYI